MQSEKVDVKPLAVEALAIICAVIESIRRQMRDVHGPLSSEDAGPIVGKLWTLAQELLHHVRGVDLEESDWWKAQARAMRWEFCRPDLAKLDPLLMLAAELDKAAELLDGVSIQSDTQDLRDWIDELEKVPKRIGCFAGRRLGAGGCAAWCGADYSRHEPPVDGDDDDDDEGE